MKGLLAAISGYLEAVLDDTAQNIPGGIDRRQIEALLSDLTSEVSGALQNAAYDLAGEGAVSSKRKPEGRRHFIGGSDARIIMGKDEAALVRLWREKRGEAEPRGSVGQSHRPAWAGDRGPEPALV